MTDDYFLSLMYLLLSAALENKVKVEQFLGQGLGENPVPRGENPVPRGENPVPGGAPLINVILKKNHKKSEVLIW